LEVLPAVVDAVGERAEVYVDAGIMSGADIKSRLAFGARGRTEGLLVVAVGDNVAAPSSQRQRQGMGWSVLALAEEIGSMILVTLVAMASWHRLTVVNSSTDWC
jgi:isopentenyl diphosphate isomerase/L-lactate dehydrogenase-like FMN-dependent dehydrogenase